MSDQTLRRMRIAAELVVQDVRAVYGDSTADYVEESLRQHFDRAAALGGGEHG